MDFPGKTKNSIFFGCAQGFWRRREFVAGTGKADGGFI